MIVCSKCKAEILTPASRERAYMEAWEMNKSNVICDDCIEEMIEDHIMSQTHKAVLTHMENNGGRY